MKLQVDFVVVPNQIGGEKKLKPKKNINKNKRMFALTINRVNLTIINELRNKRNIENIKLTLDFLVSTAPKCVMNEPFLINKIKDINKFFSFAKKNNLQNCHHMLCRPFIFQKVNYCCFQAKRFINNRPVTLVQVQAKHRKQSI